MLYTAHIMNVTLIFKRECIIHLNALLCNYIQTISKFFLNIQFIYLFQRER